MMLYIDFRLGLRHRESPSYLALVLHRFATERSKQYTRNAVTRDGDNNTEKTHYRDRSYLLLFVSSFRRFALERGNKQQEVAPELLAGFVAQFAAQIPAC